MAFIRTVSVPSTHEIDKIKGSRFMADVAPAGSEPQALAFVDSIKDREAAASHHCWAYVLADGRTRSSDDGEPGGTAGEPIARHIGGADLVDVVVVVTRYYGGTNLGMGGLVRAYGGATSAALEQAQIATTQVMAALRFEHDYELTGVVEAVLTGAGARIDSSDYSATVTRVVAVPVERAQEFVDAMTESTAGRVVPLRVD